MPKIIDNRTSLDQTVRIFDSFYATDLQVGASQYDVVHGYFLEVCATKNIADNFTAVLFRVAQEANIDVLDLLAQIKGTANKLQMNKIIAYYLNSFKSKTSLYGISVIPQANQPVARNIVQ
jgi:hypothetical protein